jgi:hypothetical protein
MKIHFGGLISLALIVIFSSCQREVNEVLPGRVNNDSTYIQQWIILDTTYPAGTDTSLNHYFYYDANKRLAKMTTYNYDLGVTGSARLLSRTDFRFTYNGSDTVPANFVETYHEYANSSQDWDDTSYLFYQNGIVSKDSAGETAGYFINKYIKLSTTRYQIIKTSVSGFLSFSDTSYSYVNWQNGNLITETDSVSIPAPPLFDITNTQMTYDNKPNPFKRVFIPYPNPLFPDIWDNSKWFYEAVNRSSNNILTWADGSGPFRCSYTYKSNGLPSVARATDGFDTLKFVYLYTKL